MRVLVFGQVALALFVIVATVLTSAGRPMLSALIGAVALVIVLAANRAFVRWAGLGEHLLGAAALATSLGTVTALALSTFVMHRLLGAGLPLLSLARCALAAGAAYWVARQLPPTPKLSPVVLIVSGLVYLAGCFATGELSKADLQAVLGSLRKGKKTPASA